MTTKQDKDKEFSDLQSRLYSELENVNLMVTNVTLYISLLNSGQIKINKNNYGKL